MTKETYHVERDNGGALWFECHSPRGDVWWRRQLAYMEAVLGDLLLERDREIERLRNELSTCSDIASGRHHAFPSDRAAAIARHVAIVLQGKTASAAGGE